MAKGFKTGAGGGTFLNFQVVGGTTPPTNPKENTLWVNAGAKITSWIFAVVEPTEPKEGMVWFKTTTSSAVEFNALKKNGLHVYLLLSKQYINGAWVDVETKCYKNDGWMEFGEYLFNYGKQTYQWIASSLPSYVADNNYHVTPGISTNADGSVTIALSDSGEPYNQRPFGSGIYRVYEAVDVTDFKTITIDAKISGYSASWLLTLYPKGADAWGNNRQYGGDSVACVELPTGRYTTTLDVSSISGTYYIGVGAWCSEHYMSYCKLNTLYMRG